MISRARPWRRACWTTAVATAVALGAAVLPSPASAATVTSLTCESGNSLVLCEGFEEDTRTVTVLCRRVWQ